MTKRILSITQRHSIEMGVWLEDDLAFIDSLLKDITSEIKNSSFFITGATGWWGKWVLEYLLYLNKTQGAGIRIHCLTRNARRFKENFPHLAQKGGVEFLEGDVRDVVLPDGYYDYVLHMSATNARETFEGISALDKFETIVYGTRNVLEFVKRIRPKSVLVASSGAVYSNMENRPIKETHNIAPLTWDLSAGLGNSKRAEEFLAFSYADKFGLNIKVVRGFSFVGPYMPLDLHYALGNFIASVLENRPIVVKSDGRAVRGYLYMADLVVWLLKILVKGKQGEAYNVGSPFQITIEDLAYLVANFGDDIEVQFKGRHKTPSASMYYYPDITKAKELGLDVFTPLKDAIAKTIDSYKTGA